MVRRRFTVEVQRTVTGTGPPGRGGRVWIWGSRSSRCSPTAALPSRTRSTTTRRGVNSPGPRGRCPGNRARTGVPADRPPTGGVKPTRHVTASTTGPRTCERDAIHKLTTALAREYGSIVVEDLNVAGSGPETQNGRGADPKTRPVRAGGHETSTPHQATPPGQDGDLHPAMGESLRFIDTSVNGTERSARVDQLKRVVGLGGQGGVADAGGQRRDRRRVGRRRGHQPDGGESGNQDERTETESPAGDAHWAKVAKRVRTQSRVVTAFVSRSMAAHGRRPAHGSARQNGQHRSTKRPSECQARPRWSGRPRRPRDSEAAQPFRKAMTASRPAI